MVATDAIVAMNEEARRLLRANGYRKPILVQHGIGADEQVWRPAQKAKEKTREVVRCFTVGYVGALLQEKGVVDLAKALVGLDESWMLVVIGDGPMLNEMEQILGGRTRNQRVDFRGMIPRGEIPPLMQTLDVLVLPSRTTGTWKEQFGLVLAEAMLCGVAVVGSDSGAIPEVIGDAGLIFPEGNVRALRDCLQVLLTDPVFSRELGAKGRQRAITQFSTSVMSEDFYSFCKSLLA
jgi:glycosyltransferase involved in cell wall biosynthesis